MDIIFIEDLRAETWIGIYPREKAMPQTVEISLQIGVSTASAGASDDIRDTVDYAVVVERLRADLAASHFNLLEKLTEHIATWLLENFAALQEQLLKQIFRLRLRSQDADDVMKQARRMGIVEFGDLAGGEHRVTGRTQQDLMFV